MTVENPKPEATPKPERKPGVVVPHAPRWHQRLIAWLIYFVARALIGTMRFRWNNQTGYTPEARGGPAIYCLWHNRLALCMETFLHQTRPRSLGNGLAVMVSASKDGALLAAVLEQFGVQPARGSSSRRGPRALLELTSWAKRGFDIGITPDGPRGPRYVVQPGVVLLAQLTGRPIIPFGYYARRKFEVRSWDRFQIPLPFSRCEMTLSKPIHVPRDATEAQREELRREVERVLMEISRD